jgi:hypothetical protein
MEKLKVFTLDKSAEKLNEYLQNKSEVIVCDTDDTLALTAEDSGKTIVLAKADGVAVSLPLAEAGLKYKFFVAVSVTSNAYSITGENVNDKFIGVVSMVDTDSADAHTDAIPDVVDDDVLTMNGSTQGGLIGTEIELECIAANRWFVRGVIRASGSVATPFDESFTTTAAPTTTVAPTTTS